MLQTTLQNQVFESILSRFPRRADAVEALCNLLNLAKDPIYRRLRGDTPLLPQELALLSRHFRISLDTLVMGQSDNVVFDFNAFSRRITSFSDYFASLNADFEQIHKMPNAHLYYASAELPVFTYSLFPELIAFKLYGWGRVTLNLEWLRNRQFSFDLITQPVLRESQGVLQQYLALPSTELWTVQIMDNTLAQIEYHLYAGGFRDSREALILLDRLQEWAIHMKAMTTAGRKFNLGEKPEPGRGEFQLFYNEMVYSNITALITSDVGRVAYSAYCTPNFLKSTDNRLCDYTQNWFDIVMAKSTALTHAADKNRDWFFREITQKVERRRQRLMLYIEENQ
ncbi:MAG: hypothetical protein ACKVT2_03740 [Saprospiraceae bacterium]